MEYRLRDWRPADFQRLCEIDQACFPPGIAYAKSTLRWFLRLPGAHCVVAEDAGEIAGFILTERDGPEAHIITLDVLEPHRRRGLGSLLLRTEEAHLSTRGVQHIELETATNNLPAVAFWRKHGYRTRGVLKSYYLDRVDAYWMEKRLEPARVTSTSGGSES